MTRRGWLLFTSMGVIWGIPYLLIAVAVREVSPAAVVVARTGIGALVLLPLAVRAGALRQLKGRWHVVLGFAVIEICVPFPLIAWAETRIPSGVSGLLIATVPIWVAVLAVLGVDRSERISPSRAAGLGLGLLGVAFLLGVDLSSKSELLGVAALLIAAVGYAGGALIIKHSLAAAPGLGTMAGGLGIATLVLAPLAWVTRPTQAPSGYAIAAIVVLGLLCTAVAFPLFFALIGEVGASRTAVITYINTAIAVLLGVAVLDEQLTVGVSVGFVLVLLGSWLATGGRLPSRYARPSRRRG